MSIIKVFHFISAIALFGMIMYFFMPIAYYINELFPTSGSASVFILFIYAALPLVNLFGSGYRFIMSMQQGE